MASGAFCNGESGAPLMACAARLAFLHLGHGDRTVPPRLEEAGMAVSALTYLGVGSVGKDYVSSRLDAEGDVPDGMAAPAIGKGEGDFAVTGPAGFPFSHFSHGNGAVAFGFVYFIVASLAVILNQL